MGLTKYQAALFSFFPALLLVGSISLTATSCGTAAVVDETIFDKVPNANAVPKPENFDAWKSVWTGDWVVGLKNIPEVENLDTRTLKQKIIQQFTQNFAFKNSHRNDALSLLNSQISTEIVPLFTEKYRPPQSEEILSFAKIRVSNHTFVMSKLMGFTNIFPVSQISEKSSVNLLWETLQSLEEVQWAEPELLSELYQDPNPQPTSSYTPYAELSYPRIRETFATFRGAETFQYVADNNVAPERQIVVGVIDTGIDHSHDKLKDQMFRNPYELEDGIDNDNDGYTDDLIGIDASLEVGDVDTGPQPIPGTADIGGPGAECDRSNGDKCGHGTHVAGIIAAKSIGSQGPLGVCQMCKLFSFRATHRKEVNGQVLELNDGIRDLSQIRALAYILRFRDLATDKPFIKVVNMSLGKYFRSRSIGYLVRLLSDNDVLVVAAAANNNTETPSYPAAFSSVLSVCALSVEKTSALGGGRGAFAKARFSNFGDWVDICAPGEKILSTFPGNLDFIEDGTSQATPIVAGAAGYLMSHNAGLSAKQTAVVLKNFANANAVYSDPANADFKGKVKDNSLYFFLGYGALDLLNSFQGARGGGTPNFIAVEPKKVGQQVTSGCVISSLAGTGAIPLWHSTMSVPFLLFGFLSLVTLFRKLKR